MKRAEISQLLPGIFQRAVRQGSPLYGILEVMEALQAPSEQVLAELESYFDPYRAPDRFVPVLAGWVDLERLLIESPQERALTDVPPLPTGLGRLRELIAAAAYLSKWRGTANGLTRFLETATGVPGFRIDEVGSFHIRISAPAAASEHRVLLERIIDMEKPAYVTYELRVGS